MFYYRTLFSGALILSAGLAVQGQEPTAREKAQIRRDRLHVAVQEICPVSGQLLGEHGPPLKAVVGEQKEEVFLCCKACMEREINPKHWATIHANFAKAQRICPVMEQELPKNPKWTFVKGRIAYVCCPPCTEKIAEDPESYLRKLDALYVAALQEKQSRR